MLVYIVVFKMFKVMMGKFVFLGISVVCVFRVDLNVEDYEGGLSRCWYLL